MEQSDFPFLPKPFSSVLCISSSEVPVSFIKPPHGACTAVQSKLYTSFEGCLKNIANSSLITK